MILNMNGGGTALNFKVIGGTTQPENPSENTIWVNTDTSVTGWAFAENDPFPIGTIATHTDDILFDYFPYGEVVIKISKVSEGRAAYTHKYVTVDGGTYSCVVALSTNAYACEMKGVRIDTTSGYETYSFPSTSSFVYEGETYYYAVVCENASLISGDHTSFEEAARTLLPIYNADGVVWFKLDENSSVPFNALVKNNIQVYTTSAKQFDGANWQAVPALIYQNGSWKDLIVHLFYDGQVNTALTGGINGTIQDGKIYFSASVAASDNKTYTTVNKIDLTNVNTVKYVITSTVTSRDVYFRALATSTLRNGANVTTSNVAAYRAHYAPFVDSIVEVSLDVSGLSGEYYLGYAWGVNSDGSKQTITGNIEGWWLE